MGKYQPWIGQAQVTLTHATVTGADMADKKKKKGMVLYSAVSSPLDRSKRFTLSSPGRPCSFRHRTRLLLEAFYPELEALPLGPGTNPQNRLPESFGTFHVL